MRRLPALITLGIFGSVIAAALANWPPLVGHPLFQAAEDGISARATAWLTTVIPLAGAASPRNRAQSIPRRLEAYEPLELVRLWQSGLALPVGSYTVLANTPAAYQWRPLAYQSWLLGASTEAAIALGIDAVVDASAADALRLTAFGKQTAQRLREAGILRAVIFDGGHHLPGLALAPDIAFLPVLDVEGVPYACHALASDAVAVPALWRLAQKQRLRTAFFLSPRLFTMAKTKRAMAILLAKALRGPRTALTVLPDKAGVPLMLRMNAYRLFFASSVGKLRSYGRWFKTRILANSLLNLAGSSRSGR